MSLRLTDDQCAILRAVGAMRGHRTRADALAYCLDDIAPRRHGWTVSQVRCSLARMERRGLVQHTSARGGVYEWSLTARGCAALALSVVLDEDAGAPA